MLLKRLTSRIKKDTTTVSESKNVNTNLSKTCLTLTFSLAEVSKNSRPLKNLQNKIKLFRLKCQIIRPHIQ